MLEFRTDLAIERKELLDGEHKEQTDYDGVIVERATYGEQVQCTRIRIVNREGEKKMGKPMGTYITLEVEGIPEGESGVKEEAGRALSEELKRLIPFHFQRKVLVAGLGNSNVTPDALGPETASKIHVTRHLFLMFGADGDDAVSNVSCIVPGVTGMTGIETADMIRNAVSLTKPDVVLIIDSLAARSIKRVSTTIQLNDTGIEPGSGMGNVRKALNEDFLGCKVVAIGVPTVINAAVIIEEALMAHMDDAEAVESYIQDHHQNLIVTSTDIDQLMKDFSEILANGINKTLHPGIYS